MLHFTEKIPLNKLYLNLILRGFWDLLTPISFAKIFRQEYLDGSSFIIKNMLILHPYSEWE